MQAEPRTVVDAPIVVRTGTATVVTGTATVVDMTQLGTAVHVGISHGATKQLITGQNLHGPQLSMLQAAFGVTVVTGTATVVQPTIALHEAVPVDET